jgi:predicted transcriptional regulator of viral defense system
MNLIIVSSYMTKKKMDSVQKIFEVANGQYGFFTARQAIKAGFAETNHPYHVRAGNWIKEGRGIYRLAHFPLAERWDLMLWYLWSRNRKDIPQGVYSHATAFSIFDLSDLNPAKLHMTVPAGFRRGTPIPKILVLHKADLGAGDTTTRFGVKVTHPMRTVIDLITAGEVEEGFIAQGLSEALKQGLIRRDEIKAVKAPAETVRALKDLLREVA